MTVARVPVQFSSQGFDPATGTASPSPGGLASALTGAGVEATWVGWPGICTEDIEDIPAMEGAMAEVGIKPVLLSQEEYDGFYEGYSNGTLWPLLHYMVERARFEDEWFGFYEQANRKLDFKVSELRPPLIVLRFIYQFLYTNKNFIYVQPMIKKYCIILLIFRRDVILPLQN